MTRSPTVLADDHDPGGDVDAGFAHDLEEFDEGGIALSDLLGNDPIRLGLSLGLDPDRFGLRAGGNDHLLLVLLGDLDFVHRSGQAFFLFRFLHRAGQGFFLLGGPLLLLEGRLFLQRDFPISLRLE